MANKRASKIQGLGQELVHLDLACKMFHISRRTAYNRIKAKHYTRVVCNGATYLKLEELVAYCGKLEALRLLKYWQYDPESKTYTNV